jgi:hypothetical protein
VEKTLILEKQNIGISRTKDTPKFSAVEQALTKEVTRIWR